MHVNNVSKNRTKCLLSPLARHKLNPACPRLEYAVAAKLDGALYTLNLASSLHALSLQPHITLSSEQSASGRPRPPPRKPAALAPSPCNAWSTGRREGRERPPQLWAVQDLE